MVLNSFAFYSKSFSYSFNDNFNVKCSSITSKISLSGISSVYLIFSFSLIIISFNKNAIASNLSLYNLHLSFCLLTKIETVELAN